MERKSKITYLNITARHGGMDILRGNLERQIFKDFEVVIVDALWEEREKEVREYFKDFDLTYVRQSKKRDSAFSNLAHADNEGFKACGGELIVCVQDFIWCAPFALHKFWEAYSAYENILVGGVGHQYCKPGKDEILNPKGKISIFKEEFTDRPENHCWSDPRMRLDQGTFYETSPVNWELSYASIPRKVIYELGGMDENFDFHGFAFDNVFIAQRAEFLGYKTYLDQTNEYRALNHDNWAMDFAKKERISPEKYYHEQIGKMIKGEIPIKLDYLKDDKLNYLQENDNINRKVNSRKEKPTI